MRKLLPLAALLSLALVAQTQPATAPKPASQPASTTAPEPGSEAIKPAGDQIPNFDPKLPNVLLIGDSISIGYTRYVVKALHGKANVVHAPGNNGDSATVAAGAKAWPAKFPQVKKWDVIHFNCGLHDLKRMKRVDGVVKGVSNDPTDLPNNDLQRYEANLRRAVADLKTTGAKLIFATTTPYPAGVKPARVPEDAAKYNAVALAVMKELDVTVDDLYTWIQPKLDKYQMPVNVHFKPEGSEYLAEQIARSIEAQLPRAAATRPAPAK